MKKLLFIAFLVFQFVSPIGAQGAEAIKPKYGPKDFPKAVPLSKSNEYFRSPAHPAPLFWRMISFYSHQATGASCGSATLAMTLNAARADLSKSSDDANISEKVLWDKINLHHWKERLSGNGYQGRHGIGLDEIRDITELAFREFGFPSAKVGAIHIGNVGDKTKENVLGHLNKLSEKTFILANVNQKVFTDDADVGHFIGVGAYDETKKRILILDPDREFYEPYWVSLETFLDGMNTIDSFTKKYRGYLLIQI